MKEMIQILYDYDRIRRELVLLRYRTPYAVNLKTTKTHKESFI